MSDFVDENLDTGADDVGEGSEPMEPETENRLSESNHDDDSEEKSPDDWNGVDMMPSMCKYLRERILIVLVGIM